MAIILLFFHPFPRSLDVCSFEPKLRALRRFLGHFAGLLVNTTPTSHACTRAIFSRARGSGSDETQMFGLQHFCARHLKNNLHSVTMPCSVHCWIHLSRHPHRAHRLPLPHCFFHIGHQPLLRCLTEQSLVTLFAQQCAVYLPTVPKVPYVGRFGVGPTKNSVMWISIGAVSFAGRFFFGGRRRVVLDASDQQNLRV